MNSRLLLDTHILVWWLSAPRKLSREQTRVLRESTRRRESLAVSAISLLELAVLFGAGAVRSNLPADVLLGELENSPAFRIVPLTTEVAAEVAALGPSLRDPADRAIVATARVHKLRLITSDQRIIDSKLVAVVA